MGVILEQTWDCTKALTEKGIAEVKRWEWREMVPLDGISKAKGELRENGEWRKVS